MAQANVVRACALNFVATTASGSGSVVVCKKKTSCTGFQGNIFMQNAYAATLIAAVLFIILLSSIVAIAFSAAIRLPELTL